MVTTKELKSNVPHVGRVDWIGRSPEREAAIDPVDEAIVEVGTGIVGDHHATGGTSQRQVTLMQAEHLPVVASISGHDVIRPEQCRRNILVSGINLLSLKECRFQIGDVVLEGTGPCVPCSRMEETIGPGGFQAMRGHGGITAVVHRGGTIHVGDAVRVCDNEPD